MCVICFEVSTLFLFQVSYEQTKRQIDRSHLYICKLGLRLPLRLPMLKKCEPFLAIVKTGIDVTHERSINKNVNTFY